MKKFALSLLSVFVILGGLLFSACDKQVSLSIGEGQEIVELFTNNDNTENSRSKTIDVSLQNSNAGVKVEILKGEDVVSVSSNLPARRSDGKYSFDISCFDKSGDAEIKVYAIDDIRAYKNIFVKVNTDLESLTAKSSNSNLGSDLFVVKGLNKSLMAEDYFDLAPITANRKDIDWTFESTGTAEFKVGEFVVAQIVNGTFVWNQENMDEFEGSSITLRATFREKASVSNIVQLDVLEMASIKSLELGENVILDGEVKKGLLNVDLKRNDNSKSKLGGTIVVKTANQNYVDINPVVYKKVGTSDILSEFEEWSKYFVFNIINFDFDATSNLSTYSFEIDSTDTGLFEKAFGDFTFFFEVKYQRYNFSISTQGFVVCAGEKIERYQLATTLYLNIGYTASSIELRGSQNQSLNNTTISAFSSYNNTLGYPVKTVVEPSDVAIDNDDFLISIELNQSAFVPLLMHIQEIMDDPSKIGTIYCGGKQLVFELQTNKIIAYKNKDSSGKITYLSSGDLVYLRAGDYDISGLQIDFVSVANPSAQASIYANLFKITNETSLSAQILGYDYTNDRYVMADLPTNVTISSSRLANSQSPVVLFVKGLSSISGLSVLHEQTDKFNVSELTRIENPTSSDGYDDGIWVMFDINLIGYDFADEVDFWLEHITGKKSGVVKATAYVPLSNVSVSSQEASALTIYSTESFKQDYEVLSEGVEAEPLENETLSKFVVEAGSNISIFIDTSLATLDGEIHYGFLTKEKLKERLTAMLESDETKGAAYSLLNKAVGQNGQSEAEFAYGFDALSDEEKTDVLKNATKSIFENFSKEFLDIIVESFEFSEDADTNKTYFTIDETTLKVADKEFSGIVMVKVNGFDDMHRNMSRIRYFALESIYAVKYLKSNLETKTLYTTETLSIADINLSFVDAKISFRPDEKSPTYSNNLSYFDFVSAQFGKAESGNKWIASDDKTYFSNDYYTISGVEFSLNGRYLNFRITANSTKFLTSFRDTISILYSDGLSAQKRTEISIFIKNMQRIEEVDWLNQTGEDSDSDGEIYLNLTSSNESEKNFTISTAVSPSDANNISLRPIYVAQYGSDDYLNITTSSSGQTFNLNINTMYGGLGYLYLLPEDMIKRVDGVEKVLVYKYSTTEEDGQLIEVETPIFVDFDQISAEYENILNGSSFEDFKNGIDDDEKSYSNFFLNNDGLPVLYEDVLLKIKIVIADGRQRETAFRVYSAQELRNVQYSNNYYEIMNDLAFENWQGLKLTDFNSTIFGHNENIVLTFKGMSESLVDSIGENGEISDLTFVGNISEGARDISGKAEAAGFVARENNGKISNVRIDVYYEGSEYKFSTLTSTYGAEAGETATNYVGGIVGINNGLVEQSFVYGLSIEFSYGTAGGIAGQNNGQIRQSGVEFYRFADNALNSIKTSYTSGIVGGIAGHATTSSLIENSYVYAYSLETTTGLTLGSEETSYYQKVLKAPTIGAFVGKAENDSKIYESFAFVGDLKKPFDISEDHYVEFKNSYLTYETESGKKQDLFIDVKIQYQQATGYTAKTQESGVSIPVVWVKGIENKADAVSWLLDQNNHVGADNLALWEFDSVNEKTNFGLVHLKNVSQSASVVVNEIQINDESDRFIRVSESQAVLFVYKTAENVTDNAQRSALLNLNEIGLTELFSGIDEITAKSLLITSNSDDILILSGKIRTLNKTLNKFTLSVHSKMDFTEIKSFEFIVVNNLPDFEALIGGRKIKEGETILIQKGTAKNIVSNLTNSVSLNGQIFTTIRDEYLIKTSPIGGADEYVDITRSNNSLVFEGKQSHASGSFTDVEISVSVSGASEDFLSALQNIRSSKFKVSVFSGATSLVIHDASELSISPSEYAPFGTTLLTDNENDNLIFGLKYKDTEILADREQDKDTNEVKFVVDSALTIDVFWSKEEIRDDEKLLGFRYDVVVKVDESKRHLIEKNYSDLVLSVNALSQKDNSIYQRNLELSVKTQEIDGISLTPYSISNRQSRNSVLYYTIGNDILTTVVPGSDQIFVVTVDPTYAKMTNFTLTYSVESQGVLGTVSISRLSRSVLYGYYADSANTTILSNGIRVDLTEDDKKGDGVFYFRVYVSTAFRADSKLIFTLTFYDGETPLEKGTGTRKLDVTYLRSATVLVNGASNYALSKGSSATVVVRAGKDQKLSSINLLNNYSGIILSYVSEEEVGEYKIFTYNLFASVTSKVVDKDGNASGNGVFNVSATVERVVNGKLEIKSALATVYLVDFAIDAENISVSSSGAKKTYNGKSYDVFYAYINSTSTLSFDYPIIPEEYNYDKNDDAESTAVAGLVEKQNEFKSKNYYQDSNIGYYINCEYNENNGTFNPMTLKEQLWYAESEEVSTRLQNYDGVVQGSNFFVVSISETSGVETVQISGKRSGIQLMKLRTNVWYQGTEFAYDYYFLIVVEVYSDEETPTQIESGEEFVKYLTESEDADDYILMNDIVLNDYTPLSTSLVNSLDGNGYTIHLNSFAEQTGDINLALFDTVAENTTLKNITVNVYQGGQIYANIATASEINVAGFALENNGIIYNCQVVAYRDRDYQSALVGGEVGLVVRYQNGSNTEPIELSGTLMDALGLSSNVAGFVIRNNASITNSRVGGTDFRRITKISDVSYVKTEVLDTFVVEGQGVVSGFAISNQSQANIAASFAKNVQINNTLKSSLSQTAGFVIENKNQIQTSFVEGKEGQQNLEVNAQKTGSSIYSMGYIGGFVYSNEGTIKNSYSNIAIENTKTKGSYVAGFVYQNLEDAVVLQCYTACDIEKYDVNQMQFSGVDEMGTSLNLGTLNQCYFFNDRASESTLQTRTTSGAFAVNKVELEESFYGFNFAAGEDTYDGIWRMTEDGPTLVSANEIALSNRYAVTSSENVTTIFYSKNILDSDTYTLVDLSYGSEYNPIILRNAYDFAVSTGKATSKEISSYKEYYDNENVFGNYRIVNNIDFSEIDQNAQNPSAISLRTTSKTFKGLLDGNGFEISNISLNGNIGNSVGQDLLEKSFGLFARLDGAVVMSLKLGAKTIVNDRARIVGTLAGLAINSRILAISLSIQENEDEGDNISVQGNNVVGGIVGMLLGDSILGGIDVENINIYSSFNQGSGVGISSNQEYTGQTLRNDIKNKNFVAFGDKVDKISYGGAIVGYVDIYGVNEAEFAKFSADVNVEDYNIVSVSVEGAVDVYAEVAGGMFGYVGPSTKLYNVSEILSNPSHIISKHLYSGGLVGENYGAIFAASVSYQTQNSIEENENSYYSNSSSSAIRGQETIFSYSSSDQNYQDRDNNPMFVGGLVGFMGGGYIYVGYNRLNVGIQKAEKHTATKAVGGIIGLLAKTGSVYQYTIDGQQLNIQTYLSDVYASGDVYNCSENGVSAGLIGSISYDANPIMLKNAMAVNYYSYTSTGLVGDTKQFVENAYTSDKHFIVAGELFNGNDLLDINAKPLSRFYVISSDNEMCALETAYSEYQVGNATVGGYDKVLISNTKTANLKPFGFKTIFDDKRPEIGVDESEWKTYWEAGNVILKAKPMGSADMNTKAKQFATMYTYFLPNGWEKAYWQHDMGDLLPHIKLEPKEKVVFWDVYNTGNILEGLANGNYSNSTIVLRGKVNKNDSDTTYKDIDLRNLENIQFENNETPADTTYKNLKFENFKGTLISYYQYFGNDEAAQVSTEIKEGTNLVGGKANSRVGIILGENSLFGSLERGATISGINFYFNPSDEKSAKIVENDVNNVVFKNISLTYNGNVTVSGEHGNVGLISSTIGATSFVGVKFVERDGANITLELKLDGTEPSINMGLLSGVIEQNSPSRPITISGVTFACENKDGNLTDSNFKVDYSFKKKDGLSIPGMSVPLNVGLLAGALTRNDSGLNTKFDVKVLNVKNDIAFGLTSDLTFTGEAYVGGYFGKVCSLNSFEIGSQEGSTNQTSKKILISENFAVSGTLYSGLVVGYADTNISVPSGSQGFVKGAIYQEIQDSIPSEAYIGGLVGQTTGSIFVNGSLVCDFSASSDKEFDKSKLDENLYDYTTHLKSLEAGTVYAGGLAGQTSANVNITSSVALSGCVEIESTSGDAYFGGLVGQSKGSVTATGAVLSSDMAVSVQVDVSAKTAYVGGLFGSVEKDSGATNQGITFNASSSNTSRINQISVISAKTIYAGAFGYVGLTENVQISGLVVGGATKIWSEKIDGGSVLVGGVVGSFEQTSASSGNVISNCSTFGDVMINYRYSDGTNFFNDKLSEYSFGGIVGSANSNGGLAVSECRTIMTNFNDKLTSTPKNLHAGAIVGKNSGTVTYSGNQYSSGACLCYQEEAGNEDLPYASGAMTGYSGYTNAGKTSSTGILSGALAANLTTDKEGSKLNPINASNFDLSNKANTNGLVWANIVSDLEWTNPGNLTNVVLVGNGNKVSVTRTSDTISGTYAGGLVNSMGDTTAPTFNVISGVVLEANIEIDMTASGFTYFGGMVGQTFGNSIIYASSVNGEISIGGSNSVNLSGFVGHMDYGIISECYSDAHLTYRANDSGILSGIAYLDNGNTLIKSTYSAGLLETYLDNDIYTFAYSNKDANMGTTNDVFECYSISQLKRNSTAGTRNPTTNILSFGNTTAGNKPKISIFNNIYNGNYDISDSENIGSGKQVLQDAKGNFALGYGAEEKKQNAISATSGAETISSWYFHPNINYGYASHNFGWLKNVTIYTRDTSATTTNEDTGVSEFVYIKSPLSEATNQNSEKTYYQAIPNVEKFEQIITGNYFLQYDVSLQNIDTSNATSKLDKNFGESGEGIKFNFDGQNKTLDAKSESDWKKSLFGQVYGTIENLRIVNVNASGVATLASSLNGTLSNVTVVGNLNNSTTGATAVGGVVADFTGTARSVEGLVNVTSSIAGYVGGLFGKVNSGSTITYSTNGGQVISTATNDLGTNAPKFTTTSLETVTEQTEQKFNAIAGGLVGYAPNGVTINYSYNANAVLVGYTTDNIANYVAGGIVGYSGDSLTLTDCHNVGLVGAGNYTSIGYSYAGGLFGYAKSVSATGCMNDGQVEAINEVTASWKYEQNNGTSENPNWGDVTAAGQTTGENEWSKNPTNVTKTLKLTYNNGKARKIYAYGLGFAEGFKTDGSFENSKTSIDNIKNDGNIGQVSQTTTLTIDRNGILNNDAQKHFYGKFGYETYIDAEDGKTKERQYSNAANVYVNGLDAYGYPYRVYMLDTVQRSYERDLTLKETDGKYKNAIWEEYQDHLSSEQYYYRYEGTYSSGNNVGSYIYHGNENKFLATGGEDWQNGMPRTYAKSGATWTSTIKPSITGTLGQNLDVVGKNDDGNYLVQVPSEYYVPEDAIDFTYAGYGLYSLKDTSSHCYYSYNNGLEGDAGAISQHISGSGWITVSTESDYGYNTRYKISSRDGGIQVFEPAKVNATGVTSGKEISADLSNFYLEGAIQPYASSTIFSGTQTTIGGATYVGYEAFLHQKLVSNLVTDDSDYTSSSSNNIDTKISAIDEKNDKNNDAAQYKVIKINGQDSVIVSSAGQFTAVYMPVTMDATFTFTAENIQDGQTLSKSNFEITGNYVKGGKSYALQYYELTNRPEPDVDKNVAASFKLYFSRGVEGTYNEEDNNLTAKLQYIKQMNDADAFTLGNSNVINVGGKAGILVKDMTFGEGAGAVNLSDIVESINNGTSVGDTDENFVYSLKTFKLDGATISGADIDQWKIIAPGDAEYLDSARMGGENYYIIKTGLDYSSFSYTKLTGATLSVKQNINKTDLTAEVSTEIDTQSVTIDGNFGAGIEKTFELFTRSTDAAIGNAAIKSDGTIIVKKDSVNDRKYIEVDLSFHEIAGVSGISKIYFDDSKHYALMYDGNGNWYAYSDGTGVFDLSISGSTLRISAPNTTGDDTLRQFVQAQGSVGNVLGANLITTKTSGESYAIDKTKTDGTLDSTGLETSISYGTRRYGDFSISFGSSTFSTSANTGYYKGSGPYAAYISDVSTVWSSPKSDADTRVFGSELGNFMIEHGVTFYDYVHTYVYDGTPVDRIDYKGADTVGYEIVYTKDSSQYTKAGKISNDQYISLDFVSSGYSFAGGDTFVLRAYKTSFGGADIAKYPLSDSEATTSITISSYTDENNSANNYTSISFETKDKLVTDSGLIGDLETQTFGSDMTTTYNGKTYRIEVASSGVAYYEVVNIDYEVQKYSNKIVTIGTLQPGEKDPIIYSYKYTINNDDGSTEVKYYKTETATKVTGSTLITNLTSQTWNEDICVYDSVTYQRVNTGTAYDYYKIIENPNQIEDLSASTYISADVVVYDFDSKNIWFARNIQNYQFETSYAYSRNDDIEKVLTEISSNMKNPSDLNGTTYKLYKDVDSKVLEISGNQDAFITYWPTGKNRTQRAEVENENKYTVSHDTSFEGFGTWDYSYSYRAEVERKSNGSTPEYENFVEPDEETKDFTNIILADDIKLDKSFGTNKINIIGNSFVVNYVVDSTNGYSLFGKNSSNILETNFLGMTSLRGAKNSGQYSLLTKINIRTISDVNVYGSMRNVKNVSALYVCPFVWISSGTLSNAKSYITVNGLDADDGIKDVKTNIIDIVVAAELSYSNYQSQNILIAGNGKSKIAAGNIAGGTGGSISVSSTENIFNGKARGGNSGVGSYGSDGENGTGNAGANGTAGSVSGTTSIKQRTPDTNMAGNAGMVKYGSEINAGKSNVNDILVNIKYILSNTEERNEKLYVGIGFYEFSLGKIKTLKGQIDDELKKYSGVGSIFAKIEMVSKADMHADWTVIFWGHTYTITTFKNYRITIWTTGEYINNSGDYSGYSTATPFKGKDTTGTDAPGVSQTPQNSGPFVCEPKSGGSRGGR